MIAHEEARKQTKFIHQTHRQEIMSNYIAQQEKKDKLLGLYRKTHGKNMNDMIYEEFIIVEHEIKALEEELK